MMALQEVGCSYGASCGDRSRGVGASGWDDHGIGGAFGAAREAMGLPNGDVGEGFWDSLSKGIDTFGDIYRQRQQGKILQKTGVVIPIQPASRQKDYSAPPIVQQGGLGSIPPAVLVVGALGLVLVLTLRR